MTTTRRRETLTVVELPLGGRVVDAPPVVTATANSIDFCCGNCGAVLMQAEEGHVHRLIHCTWCSSYNSTDGFSD
jgi:hypothetical protein